MEIVEKKGFKAVGIQVVAEWEQLFTEMPKKWKNFKQRLHEIKRRKNDVMMDISRSEESGVYVQLICVEVDEFEDVPQDMATLRLPGQKYIHHRHEGVVEKIAATFGEMYDWAEKEGIDAGMLKIDYGYLPDGSEEYHDLYIRVENQETASGDAVG